MPPPHKHHTFLVGTSQRQNPSPTKVWGSVPSHMPTMSTSVRGGNRQNPGNKMKDHTSHNTQPTAVGDHCREHGDVINKNNVEVLAREGGWFKRKKPRPHSQPSTETKDSTCPRSTAKFYLSVLHVIAVVRRAVTQPRRSGQLPVAARRRRRDVFESLRLQANKDS